MFDTKKLALFLGGVVFGSAGFKVLSSKDAKKIYTQTTAAVLRQETSLPMQRPSTRAAPPRLHRRLSRIRLKSSPQSRLHSDTTQRSRPWAALFYAEGQEKQ